MGRWRVSIGLSEEKNPRNQRVSLWRHQNLGSWFWETHLSIHPPIILKLRNSQYSKETSLAATYIIFYFHDCSTKGTHANIRSMGDSESCRCSWCACCCCCYRGRCCCCFIAVVVMPLMLPPLGNPTVLLEDAIPQKPCHSKSQATGANWYRTSLTLWLLTNFENSEAREIRWHKEDAIDTPPIGVMSPDMNGHASVGKWVLPKPSMPRFTVPFPLHHDWIKGRSSTWPTCPFLAKYGRVQQPRRMAWETPLEDDLNPFK